VLLLLLWRVGWLPSVGLSKSSHKHKKKVVKSYFFDFPFLRFIVHDDDDSLSLLSLLFSSLLFSSLLFSCLPVRRCVAHFLFFFFFFFSSVKEKLLKKRRDDERSAPTRETRASSSPWRTKIVGRFASSFSRAVPYFGANAIYGCQW
jgi:hypothetical protein